MNRQKQAEITAEAFAAGFLEETTGHDIFIGSHIERMLANRAVIIYQYVEDESYYGAAITHQSGEQFIALNTFHPLRIRYFTAAHEMWHLSEASQLQDASFDHERAADRFAAAIMMPKSSTKDLWSKLKKTYEPEEAVVHFADLSSVPYQATVRRLQELGENINGVTLKEEDWIKKRVKYNLPGSFLDSSQPFTQFTDYEYVVEKVVQEEKLNPLTAANKIVRFNPKLSENLQELEIERLKEAGNDET